MEVEEERQGSEDQRDEDRPYSLARLDTAVDMTDPTTLEQKIRTWNHRRTVLTAYINEHMKEGIDYYTLTIDGKVSKPSLSKAGSEKILSLLNVHAKFRQDDPTWAMVGRPAGVICYVCELYTKRGEFVGEGRGAREVRQDQDVSQDQDINKAIKMAQKSAQIDAVLRTGALSDSFTQDLEDRPTSAARTVPQQKKQIVALLKLLGTGGLDKAGYEEVVQHYTGLALVPTLYADIIHRLEECVTEHLCTSSHGGEEHRRVS